MTRRRHTPEQILQRLRDVEVLQAEGHSTAEIAKRFEVSEQMWRNQFGGMKGEEMKRPKELERRTPSSNTWLPTWRWTTGYRLRCSLTREAPGRTPTSRVSTASYATSSSDSRSSRRWTRRASSLTDFATSTTTIGRTVHWAAKHLRSSRRVLGPAAPLRSATGPKTVLVAGALDVLLVDAVSDRDQAKDLRPEPITAFTRADVFEEGNRHAGTCTSLASIEDSHCRLQIEGALRLEIGERVTRFAPWTMHCHESRRASLMVAEHRVETNRGRRLALASVTRIESAIERHWTELQFEAQLKGETSAGRTARIRRVAEPGD